MTAPDNMSLFWVPLQCPAAPEIACGGRAKPILLALDGDPNISQAWVNRAGTVLVVIGSETSSRASRAMAVQRLLEEIYEKKVATEIDGEARQKEVASFHSGRGWYRGVQTDDLSREEHDIIARRLVGRMQARVAVSAEQAKALEADFAEVFKRRYLLRQSELKTERKREERRSEELHAVCEQLAKVVREHLGEAGASAIKEALTKGYRPQPGER
jgi:hypothetical protein